MKPSSARGLRYSSVTVPLGWALYALGVIVLGVLARVGWELGGRVWMLLG